MTPCRSPYLMYAKSILIWIARSEQVFTSHILQIGMNLIQFFVFSWSIFHYTVHVDKNNQSKSRFFFIFCFFPIDSTVLADFFPLTKKTPADVGGFRGNGLLGSLLGNSYHSWDSWLVLTKKTLTVMWPKNCAGWLYDDISDRWWQKQVNMKLCMVSFVDTGYTFATWIWMFQKTSVDVTKLMHDNQKHKYPNAQVILLIYSQCMFRSKYRHEHHLRQCKPLKDKWPNNRCFVMSQDIPLLNMFKWMREGIRCQAVPFGE